MVAHTIIAHAIIAHAIIARATTLRAANTCSCEHMFEIKTAQGKRGAETSSLLAGGSEKIPQGVPSGIIVNKKRVRQTSPRPDLVVVCSTGQSRSIVSERDCDAHCHARVRVENDFVVMRVGRDIVVRDTRLRAE